MSERVPGVLTALAGLGVFVAITNQAGAVFHLAAFAVTAALFFVVGVARD